MATPRVRRVLIIGSWTFFLSAVLNFGSISALGSLSLLPSLLVLLLVVAIGIIFDIVGTAAAAARQDPFCAMASQRIRGSKEALRIVQAADAVASFCNDVVGDICGTLSGAVVATIVFQIASAGMRSAVGSLNAVLVALTAAITVGGKAWGKGIAIHNHVAVLMAVGRLVYFTEHTLRLGPAIDLLLGRKRSGRKGKARSDTDSERR
jgi:CBS domain containing-hemolysin-like protein